MRLIIAGSGTAVPDPERACAAYAVQTTGHWLLLDCGPGALQHLTRFGVPWGEFRYVALTHFHTDHIGALPFLFFALEHGLPEPRTLPLTIIGPPGTSALLDRMADAFGESLRDPGFPVDRRELASGDVLTLEDGTRLGACATPHTGASIAYRIDAPEGALGYTGDTGESDALGAFFEGVDILLAECSLPDDLAIDPHLTPTRVAALARRARPERLLLTHIYPQLDPARIPNLIRAAGWPGYARPVRDGMRFDIGTEPKPYSQSG
ncbi:MAG TPA: ribonuclease Z [Longimicrobiales bacterium]